ncbi:GNAT family N-acetyltransferase [Corynebacterium kalidii]|jgi:predicted GNAT family acetyltransferase|uniref:N-acetyltransferase n=1 Tax=Corynebacterium kalidii TaxID=2931982 RepID=A0A9X1WHK0_9CORY|nr:GNAT family N-acetyltransferase [Corynebacterium kalidii]MCJ7858338.1 N-acetyltransferase [Corynebacterium kalidii]
MMGELTDKNGDSVTVRLTSKGNAYALYLEDGTRAGATYFVDRGSERIFHHTIVGDDYTGRGLGSILVREALAATRAAELTVVPSCQFVASWIGRNGYDGPVTDPTPETDEYVLQHAGEA